MLIYPIVGHGQPENETYTELQDTVVDDKLIDQRTSADKEPKLIAPYPPRCGDRSKQGQGRQTAERKVFVK